KHGWKASRLRSTLSTPCITCVNRGQTPIRIPRVKTTDDSLREIRDALRRFAAERDWEQFHSPKNLAIALSVEASELLEHFQWLTDKASTDLPPDTLARVREEMADVLLYLVRLADKLDVVFLVEV